jgi:RimJ/RimL family protein N-acetyltransferase
MNKYFWQAEHIRLRQIEPDDWETFYLWDLDSETQRNLDKLPFPRSKQGYQDWVLEASKKTPKDDNFSMVIEEIATGSFVGSISSHSTDRRIGTFAYGLAIIPDFQRRGFAKEAILLLMQYFFEELRYQKCTVTVHEWNEASIKLHEHMGFVKEGQHRRMLYTRGRYWDVLYYGMTIEEWRGKYGDALNGA